MLDYKIIVCGDSAVTVNFGEEVNPKLFSKVHALFQNLQKYIGKGICDLIPAFCSLTVCYDPSIFGYAKICRLIEKNVYAKNRMVADKKIVHHIPVCYGGEYGADLSDVAAHAGISVQEVVSRHCGRDYLIYMIGFLPGFPYLGDMDEKLVTPRLDTPRTAIPAGSVGIGGNQTGIYPVASPGGWRLIGKTPEKMYDQDRTPPVVYAAGEYIRFVPISVEQYAQIEREVLNGTYQHVVTEESI